MSLPSSPFNVSSSTPGEGVIELCLLSPRKQVLSAITFQYPLKLITPDPHTSPNERQDPVTVVFILTYGGGLVGGDRINLRVRLADQTKLVLLTQGSTKVFKSASSAIVSGQTLDVSVGKGSALCYLPDPIQPFGNSAYEQRQTFRIDPEAASSLCLLDWISEGRRARGESWTLHSLRSRNEVRELVPGSNVQSKLLLRDAVILSGNPHLPRDNEMLEKMNGMGVFGTLILYGPVFRKLGDRFLNNFSSQPRIGAKDWASGDLEKSLEALRRDQDWRQEQADALLWTVARVRGFFLVKFGAREVEGARRWLRAVIREEGSIEAEFGHQALFCLR